jgi:release factor glutamine methyltransferase
MEIEQALVVGKEALLDSESPLIDCQFLLCHLLQCNLTYLHTWPDKELTDKQQKTYFSYLRQRVKGQPVAHIIGQRGFWSLNLKVSSETLIPRPDTEILVRSALEKIEPGMVIADLGTGTGAVALALASERTDVNIIATDFSGSALAIARQNKADCQLQNVALWQGDWLSAVADNSLDMIVSNPPYMESNDPH